jgi:LmbE family N-acetylglucosaminyl deacetylase
MRVLVIAAHPDDEVLGCGGTILRHSKEGEEVYITILGEGITSRYRQRELADKSLTHALRANCKKVAKCLGIKDLIFYSLPDNRFDSVPLLDVIKIVEEVVERFQPNIIYTHHGGDLNIDHAIVHRAVLTAVRPTVSPTVRDIFLFEVASSTEWAFQQFTPVFRPNVFVDISRNVVGKITAMALYESEERCFPHPRSAEALRSQARRWGAVAGLEYAEAFELVRSIR